MSLMHFVFVFSYVHDRVHVVAGLSLLFVLVFVYMIDSFFGNAFVFVCVNVSVNVYVSDFVFV